MRDLRNDAPGIPDIERLRLNSDRRLVASLCALVCVPVLWGIGVHLREAGDWQRIRLPLLIDILTLVVPSIGIVLVTSARTPAAYSRAVYIVSLATVVMLLALDFLRPRGSVLPMRMPMMFLMLLYGAMPNTLARQIVPPLLFSIGVVVVRAIWLTGDVVTGLPTDVMIMAFVNAVGILIVRRRVTLEREVGESVLAEQAARQGHDRANSELRALRGIIPICSHCKKVRTDPGGWQRIEVYVAQHMTADVSHGICPDCLRQHYPPFTESDGE